MRRLIIALLLVLPTIVPASATIDDDRARAILTAAVDGFVRPAYKAFATATDELSTKTDALCEAPSGAALETARTAFVATVAAWSHVEPIGFGPITAENRLERILFWPDRRGIGLKQVQSILATEDATATDPTTLAGKSVASQGLGALEFTLFGTDADQLATAAPASFRCRYAAAIAVNLQTMAADLDTAWANDNGIASYWTGFNPSNDRYRSSQEALGELIDVAVHGLEQVRDVRLNGFLGATADADKPRSAIWWRSGQTVAALEANLEAMRQLMATPGLADLVSEDGGWIPGSIDYEFANAESVLAGLDGPIDQILADPDRRAKLAFARQVTSSLSGLAGQRLTADIGLTVGFSSLDGD